MKLLTWIITVLSIAAIGSSAAALRYYASLDKEVSYYGPSSGDSTWWGKGAHALGLEGRAVHGEELRQLLRGYAPDGSRPLVQLGRGHQPGWDLTFSAPKSVSIVAALSPREIGEAIERAHLRACRKGLEYVEENVHTRRGKGGRLLEGCGLVVLLVTHRTSRANDMQLHTHAVTLNLAYRSDGTFGALRGRDLYRLKMAADACYRAELARELRGLGIALEQGKHSFEIAGVPKALMSEFSTRRKEIEADLTARGESGSRAAEASALRTRQRKVKRDPAKLLGEWESRAAELEFSPADIARLVPTRSPRPDLDVRIPLATIERAADRLANEKSGFTRGELFHAVTRMVEHHGPSTRSLNTALDAYLQDERRAKAIPLTRKGEERYAPAWLVERERSLLEVVDASKWDRREASERSVRKSLRRSRTLSEEQKAAVRHVTLGIGSVKCIVGLAGTGKSTVLRTVNKAYARGRRRVIGVAVAAQAARELEKASGIPSCTVARFLRQSDPKASTVLRHHVHQFSRAIRGRRTWAFERQRLNKRTVLVVDEAAMVGTVQLEAMLRVANTAGAKVILVGDPKQLQAIPAGGGFSAICRTLGAAELRSVRRQQKAWMREAVNEISEGDARGALSRYAAHGRVHVAESKPHAIRALIRAWSSERTTELGEKLVLATTRDDVRELNELAQADRMRAGGLGSAIRFGSTRVREGDRILITSNHRGLGVVNGDRGVLEYVHAVIPNRFARVTVRLDRTDGLGRPVRVSFTPSSFSNVELGYAMTTHRAQGTTVATSFVLGDRWLLNREHGIVALSRHTDDARVFVARDDAGKDLSALAGAMSKSRRKELGLLPNLEYGDVS